MEQLADLRRKVRNLTEALAAAQARADFYEAALIHIADADATRDELQDYAANAAAGINPAAHSTERGREEADNKNVARHGPCCHPEGH